MSWVAVGKIVLTAVISAVASRLLAPSTGAIYTQDSFGGDASPSFGVGLKNTVSKDLPKGVVYGKMRIAGNVIHAERRPAIENNAVYREVIAVGEGPVHSMTEIKLEDLDWTSYDAANKGYAVWLGAVDQVSETPDTFSGLSETSFVNDARVTTETNDLIPEQV